MGSIILLLLWILLSRIGTISNSKFFLTGDGNQFLVDDLHLTGHRVAADNNFNVHVRVMFPVGIWAVSDLDADLILVGFFCSFYFIHFWCKINTADFYNFILKKGALYMHRESSEILSQNQTISLMVSFFRSRLLHTSIGFQWWDQH